MQVFFAMKAFRKNLASAAALDYNYERLVRGDQNSREHERRDDP